MNSIKIILLIFIGIFLSTEVFPQTENITVKGMVKDENGDPLVGANVVIKNKPGLGVAADINGRFTIKAQKLDVLLVTFIGYETKQVQAQGDKEIVVQLFPSTRAIDEVTVVASGVQKKETVVGAITTVNVADLKHTSSAQLSNSLAGNVAGIIAMQRSGEPGANYSEFWIRGIGTFGANDQALVLVDGIERNFNEINAEDIESFSVLKDASATAIYGQRGANGVVLITTKRGEAGKVKISVKGEFGLSTPSRMPEYVDGVTYAELANEASKGRGNYPVYTDAEMEIIKYGMDPDLYPNMDWQSTLFKDVTTNHRVMLNISGGGETARYYVSGAYYNEAGMFKYGDLNNYDTNIKYKRFNFRANVDMNITKSTILEVGIGGWVTNQNKPGSSSDDIWGSIAGLTPLTVPFIYSNGLYPTYGTDPNQMSPYVLLTQTGYKNFRENKMETNVALRQNLDFITPGLNLYGRFSYDAYNYHEVDRLKQPDLYHAEKQRDGKGNLVMKQVGWSKPLQQTTTSWGDYRYYAELNLNYNRLFAERHRVGALLLYYQQEYARNDAGGDVYKAIPNRNMALSGRLTYAYNDTYMLEANFGYTGSENFEKNSRFGFFPAIAAGWLISNESFIKDYVPWLSNLKLRYSYGEVGNDKMDSRFPYKELITNGSGVYFGENNQTHYETITIGTLGAENLTWEVAKKHNLGVDLGLFDRFNLTVDFFRDMRENIFMLRANLPMFVGVHPGQKPWGNVGRMKSMGFDGTTSYSQKIGEVQLTLRGNFTFSKSEILDYDEAMNARPYQQNEGYRFNQTRGLIALGLFKDQAEIDASPLQTFGEVLPGDIKYKDVDGNGKIDEYDVVPIGYTTVPGFVYGFGASAIWKNFDFNVLFQGSGNCDFFIGGTGVYPFSAGEYGNVLKCVSDSKDRWIPREISGTPDTENPNAQFPRLTYGNNLNNNRASSFWLRNSRYLRLKNVEIGYNLPSRWTRKLRMENARFYVLGNNLLVFDKLKWWDPELASGNGAKYPISRTVTIGLSVNF